MSKYILKPGVHQIEPGSRDQYTKETMTDEIAESILARYPHAITFFEPIVEEKVTAPAKSLPLTETTPEEFK